MKNRLDIMFGNDKGLYNLIQKRLGRPFDRNASVEIKKIIDENLESELVEMEEEYTVFLSEVTEKENDKNLKKDLKDAFLAKKSSSISLVELIDIVKEIVK